jgi:hypothetical protein
MPTLSALTAKCLVHGKGTRYTRFKPSFSSTPTARAPATPQARKIVSFFKKKSEADAACAPAPKRIRCVRCAVCKAKGVVLSEASPLYLVCRAH